MRLLLLPALLFSALVFSQGPVDGYFKGKGNLDLALSGAWQHSDTYYSGIGLINYERNLTSISLFGEYGISERVDAIVSAPMINGKLQDAAVFLKAKWPARIGSWNLPVSVIPAFGVSLPMSDYATETGQAIGQRATQVQPRLVLQYQHKSGVFIQVQGGYNYTLDPVPSSIPASAKIGFSKKQWYLDAWFDYQNGLGDKEWLSDPISSFRELYVSYSKIGGVVYYGLKPGSTKRYPEVTASRLGFFINGSYILTGTNIGKAFSIGTGVVFKLHLIK